MASANYSREELLDSIREVAEELGHAPSASEYREFGNSPSVGCIRKRFDGWTDAKEEAGLDVEYKRRTINEDYFKSIDSPEKAYWLGLFYADGSVYQENGHDRFSIALKDCDRYLLEEFLDTANSNYRIYDDERSGNASDMGHLIIANQEFISHLKSHGLDNGKTLSEALPELTEEQKPAFFRGIFDGDGSVNSRQLKVTGASRKRLEKLSEWVPCYSAVYEEDTHSDLSVYYTDRTEIIDWMYPEGADTSPKLERKYSIIERYT